MIGLDGLGPYSTAPAQRLLGLLEFEHEFIHRLVGWRLDREITRVLGMTPKIALGDKLEPGSLDLAAQRTLFDAMQGLAD